MVDSTNVFKRDCQQAAALTERNIRPFGLRGEEFTRGESCYLIYDRKTRIWYAHVDEDLGTKILIATEMFRLTNVSHFAAVAQDAIAMIVNDIAAVGARPISVTMHIKAGKFLSTEDFPLDHLVRGWRDACNIAQCVWAGGQTSVLEGLVDRNGIILSGSGLGLIRKEEWDPIDSRGLCHGDVIIFLGSSGIHSNELTFARTLAGALPEGYRTRLSDGRPYGETLLDPTIIYAPFIIACLEEGIDIHYAVHITGGGWKKLMRAVQPFVYKIDRIPEPQPIFQFIRKHSRIDNRILYATLNMGAGYALFVEDDDVDKVIGCAQAHSLNVMVAGSIRERGDEKSLIIEPLNIEYEGSELAIR